MKLQLEVLARWLKEYSEELDERDGTLEQAIKDSRVETMFKIGDYIEEILEMDDEQLEDNLK